MCCHSFVSTFHTEFWLVQFPGAAEDLGAVRAFSGIQAAALPHRSAAYRAQCRPRHGVRRVWKQVVSRSLTSQWPQWSIKLIFQPAPGCDQHHFIDNYIKNNKEGITRLICCIIRSAPCSTSVRCFFAENPASSHSIQMRFKKFNNWQQQTQFLHFHFCKIMRYTKMYRSAKSSSAIYNNTEDK